MLHDEQVDEVDELDECDDEQRELIELHDDIEHKVDEVHKRDIEVLEMLLVYNGVDEIEVEYIDLDDEDDIGDEMVQREMVVLGMINEREVEVDIFDE